MVKPAMTEAAPTGGPADGQQELPHRHARQPPLLQVNVRPADLAQLNLKQSRVLF